MGRYLAFWASVPWVMMGSQHRPLWVATMSPVEAHCLDSSSMQMALARGSAPAPPYSLGTHMPITPRLNSFSMFSRGYWLVGSDGLHFILGEFRHHLPDQLVLTAEIEIHDVFSLYSNLENATMYEIFRQVCL